MSPNDPGTLGKETRPPPPPARAPPVILVELGAEKQLSMDHGDV